jgi:hypothetical protein
MNHSSPLPSSIVTELQRLTRTELSRGARIGHVVLALVASAMTVIVVSLWLTEPALPLRTRIAFAALTGIGTGWTVFAVWVLSTRRVMLARHRQVAGRLAVLFSSVFTVVCLVLALAAETNAARPALGMSLGLLMIAAVVWRRAERAQAKLLVRRAQLEQELDRRPE